MGFIKIFICINYNPLTLVFKKSNENIFPLNIKYKYISGIFLYHGGEIDYAFENDNKWKKWIDVEMFRVIINEIL